MPGALRCCLRFSVSSEQAASTGLLATGRMGERALPRARLLALEDAAGDQE